MSHNIKDGLNSSLLNIKRGKGHQTFDERSNMKEETKRNKKNEVKRNSHTERRTSKKKKQKQTIIHIVKDMREDAIHMI